ncbi:MAG: hypothetical protein DRJ49_00445 [Thermoprotei archaeon]|nr:MAG: hypothetical protein DRN53_01755 [Thermoprotei archaeon]RLE90278.1 MAG: hypothetical protein DRJ49_00445 [Thermoprotei archaeon]
MVAMLKLLHRILTSMGSEKDLAVITEGYTEEVAREETVSMDIGLKKLLWKEERTDELQAIPADFYTRLSSYIKIMKENKDEKMADRMECLAVDLLRRRLQKILGIVSTNPRASKELMDKMSFEEKVLYNTLCKTVAAWENYMSRYVGGGD